ncbi:TPA: oligopeptide ABC transporter substrate-binding protein OppA [Vibrio parahaemolyticus]|uniref:ABC transporter substrate-binding protein n=1 Tax=Vibrio parahaemolyticus TaxID=670 RepID=A0AA47L904_VIBPH|nr:ABC transporter substrate-binding protein [Vibrio parahaemolyticus]MCX8774466.1 ABC transporter substrate-binding protein [Vibrio parahaemolyticus]MEA5349942.1 ABC transporter substrate-binding protein [Vibrio parahaemolyticus]ODY77765.1 oligopeptide ABC transporter substrate-binding protein OppA [Vibrio parahaemolyticus]TOP05330.1 oligopeptide ABC transporter substrate-binding protein OppA [Vibrio parahaemolyticus]TOP15950.1 oligopeptide ABC transporter substrate-binding protein OppA [Vibr
MDFKKHSTALLISSLFTPFLSASVVADTLPNGVQLAAEQHLVRANDAEAATLDPAKAEGLPEMHVIRDLFEGLVIQDRDGNIIPGVAESWETKDNLTFVFHLRKDAKWSNGEPVTADDFVYSLRRAVDPKTASPNVWYLKLTKIKNIADVAEGKRPLDDLGIAAVDKYTLRFELDSQVPYFVAMTGHTSMMPVHQATVESRDKPWSDPDQFVSNGAFTLDKWVVNERIELVKNPNYWDNADTHLNKVTYIPFENQNASINRYAVGEVDITSDVPTHMAQKLKQDYKQAYTVVPLLCTYYYAFNTTRPPFDDARVRQAVSYSIMRDVITNGVTQVGNLPAYTFAHQYTAGFDATPPEYSNWSQQQRDEKARELLKEAGYGDGKPLDFKLLYNTSEANKSIAVAIASMLHKNLGANVELENQEWKSYLVARKQGNFDVMRASWCGDYNEASTFLSLLRSGSSGNFARYSSQAYDNVMNSALAATDEKARQGFYDQAEQLLAADMPIAPIYYYMQARLVRPTVGGFAKNNVEGRIYSKDLYIKK